MKNQNIIGTHWINESHIGTDATRDEAIRLTEILREAGYSAEYTPTQGGSTTATAEDGKTREIPDSVWFDSLNKVVAETPANANP